MVEALTSSAEWMMPSVAPLVDRRFGSTTKGPVDGDLKIQYLLGNKSIIDKLTNCPDQRPKYIYTRMTNNIQENIKELVPSPCASIDRAPERLCDDVESHSD